MEQTPILIVGGGPVGLTLAAELGIRNVECILISQNFETSTHPKCNLSNARTMEHFRRLGVSREVRRCGLPSGHRQDVVYYTRLVQHEFARYRLPSADEAREQSLGALEGWPTPEPPYRISQIYLERVLKSYVEKFESVSVRFGWQLDSFDAGVDGVSAKIINLATEEKSIIRCKWLVGCDGGASLVREASGLQFKGDGEAKRAFMGGAMMATYYRSPDLAKILSESPEGHMLWAFNNELRSCTVKIDGDVEFLTHIQLPDGADPNDWDPHEFIPRHVSAKDIKIDVISSAVWRAGLRLVADSYQKGHVLIAGDAAHLFTPTGGFGMNTGIDDAANLGWKLAADIQGWGGEHLIETYTKERQPVGIRNTSAAKVIADHMGSMAIPDGLEEEGAVGEAARAKLGAQIPELTKREFNTIGVQLGVRYDGSALVVDDESQPPQDKPNSYTPNACPGSRAPHAILKGDVPLFDVFGHGFTLLCFDEDTQDAEPLMDAAAVRGLPIKLVCLNDKKIARLYEKRLVLIRPDGHIAWRADLVPNDVLELIDVVRGCFAEARSMQGALAVVDDVPVSDMALK